MTDSRFPDDWSDDFDERESPDADEFLDDTPAETIPCPQCGHDVYEESERCPACGSYIVHDTSIWSGRPAWWIVLGLLGIAAVVLALSLGF